jgi:flagellar hook protein FlgE
MSLFTSLTGLTGAQSELSTISNNIANTGTVGFKRSRVEFGDIVAASPASDPRRITGVGTAVRSVTQQFAQGAIQTTQNALDLAVTGQGFFAVKPKPPSNELSFTRAGGFSLDANRYVVDAQGLNLQVLPVNAEGQTTASGLDALRPLRLPATSGEPRATTAIKLAMNLPSDAPVIPSNPRYTPQNPYAFDPADPTTFNQSTSTTIHDALGNPLVASVYYVRTHAATQADPEHRWTAHVLVGDTEVQTAGGGPLRLTFDASGRRTAPLTGIGFAPLTPPAGGPQLSFSVEHTGATTQYADPFTVLSATQDGFASGRLDGVTVSNEGVVNASFTNGRIEAVGKVALANFANLTGLRQTGNAHYAVTGTSGEPQIGEPGVGGFGGILSGSLERSNVDITEELVGLITAQRNFQANAKAIEAGATMMQSVIQIRT